MRAVCKSPGIPAANSRKLGWIEGGQLFGIDPPLTALDDPTRIRTLTNGSCSASEPDLMVSNSNLVTAILQSEVRDIPAAVPFPSSDPIGSGFRHRSGSSPNRQCNGVCQFPTFDGSKWLELLRQNCFRKPNALDFMYFSRAAQYRDI